MNSQTRVEAASVAIIGAACKLPGAPDETAFWHLLTSGHCAVSPESDLPPGRWRPERYLHPRRTEAGLQLQLRGRLPRKPVRLRSRRLRHLAT